VLLLLQQDRRTNSMLRAASTAKNAYTTRGKHKGNCLAARRLWRIDKTDSGSGAIES
jgi:hypothetical protein